MNKYTYTPTCIGTHTVEYAMCQTWCAYLYPKHAEEKFTTQLIRLDENYPDLPGLLVGQFRSFVGSYTQSS